jgi:hypothetical protein
MPRPRDAAIASPPQAVLDNLDTAVSNGSSISTWTAEAIAYDLSCHSPAFGGRDPEELVPFVREWLQKRRKA